MSVEKTNTGEKKGENNQAGKLSKFLPYGKYFLILLFIVGQGFLAYAIVDKNYGQVYTILNSAESAETATYQMEDLVVNPAGTNGKRFLLVQISLEIDNIEHIPLLEENTMKLKQDMIETLSARTVYQLTNLDEREILRKELSDIINTTIGTPSVRNLYFTKYVMQ